MLDHQIHERDLSRDGLVVEKHYSLITADFALSISLLTHVLEEALIEFVGHVVA